MLRAALHVLTGRPRAGVFPLARRAKDEVSRETKGACVHALSTSSKRTVSSNRCKRRHSVAVRVPSRHASSAIEILS